MVKKEEEGEGEKEEVEEEEEEGRGIHRGGAHKKPRHRATRQGRDSWTHHHREEIARRRKELEWLCFEEEEERYGLMPLTPSSLTFLLCDGHILVAHFMGGVFVCVGVCDVNGGLENEWETDPWRGADMDPSEGAETDPWKGRIWISRKGWGRTLEGDQIWTLRMGRR